MKNALLHFFTVSLCQYILEMLGFNNLTILGVKLQYYHIPFAFNIKKNYA